MITRHEPIKHTVHIACHCIPNSGVWISTESTSLDSEIDVIFPGFVDGFLRVVFLEDFLDVFRPFNPINPRETYEHSIDVICDVHEPCTDELFYVDVPLNE